MRNSVFGQKRGNTFIAVTVGSAVALTALVGLMQLTATYSKQLAKERNASSLQMKKEMALQYLLSKFTTRSMANGNQGVEWIIQNVSGKVKVTANSGYCYQSGCSSLTDPLKVPIRDVYKRWMMVQGQNMCVLVTPYQEFQGAAILLFTVPLFTMST